MLAIKCSSGLHFRQFDCNDSCSVLTCLNSCSSVCFLTRSSGSSIRCCRSVLSSVVSSQYLIKIIYEQTDMCFNTSSCTGISLANLKAWRRAAAFFLLVSNLAAALYTGLIHQRGTLDVMTRLQTLCDVSNISSPPQTDVLFLMPCHSTPFYRYVAAFHISTVTVKLLFNWTPDFNNRFLFSLCQRLFLQNPLIFSKYDTYYCSCA